MIKHYFEIAARTLRKHAGYTFIHLTGLACGFAVALLIFLFVQDELSYDRFHSKADRIARLIAYRSASDGQKVPVEHMPLPLGQAVIDDVSSAKAYARITGATESHVIAGNVQEYEQITYADPALFTIFDFPLLEGNPNTLFRTPAEAVITERVALKFFGKTDVVGERLEVFLQGERRPFTVVGVAKTLPTNSTIQFAILVPMTAIFRYEIGSTRWNWWRVNTYVEFDRPVKEIDSTLINSIVDRHWADRTKAEAVPLKLQPLAAVHLDPETGGSNPLYSYILSAIAFVILVIAGINYVSLGIARGTVRAREVAVRKLFGAIRGQVIAQFLAESLLLAILALAMGLALAELALPSFNAFVGKSLDLSPTSNLLVPAFGIVMALVVGIGAGIVPATLLSRPMPAEIFRKAGSFAKSGIVMRGMIIVQFALSTFLIIATIIMHQQNQHLQQRPLGYSAESVMVVERPPDNSIADVDFLQRFKNELASDPRILGVSATSASFNRGYDAYGWEAASGHMTAYVYRVDPSYVSVLKMNIESGRDFALDPTLDVANPIVVNESFMKQLGPGFAVGSPVPALDTMFEQYGTPTIVGVVKDYNFLSLHEQIGPVLLFTKELYPYFQLLVRIDNNDVAATTAAVEQAYERISGGLRCNWTFLEDDLAAQYTNENRWSRIVSSSAVFAICIAALGMFGLAGISAVRRSREVGIRKVLGATVLQVLRLINREFLYLVLAANIAVWPLAWFSAKKWLQNFAYPIDLSVWSFVLAAIVASGIAMIAVSAHTLKAALQNPADVLRSE